MNIKPIIYLCISMVLSLIAARGVLASELLGKISTGINEQPKNNNETTENNNAPPGESSDKIADADDMLPSNNSEGQNYKDSYNFIIPHSETLKKNTNPASLEDEIKVLGISGYADGTLLRDPDKRIYIIEGQAKKYIPNLHELQKYQGRIIIDVSTDDSNYFQMRRHLNGELIRETGTKKVYVIKNGKRKHILNPEELKLYYAGLEIFNIDKEEMLKYK